MTNDWLLTLRERLTKINNQLIFLDVSCRQLTAKDPKSFTEQLARRDIGTIVKDISFLEQSVIYHLEHYLDGLNNGLCYIKQYSQKISDRSFMPLPHNISNQISFEFEAYIISFQKLIEEPTPQIVKGALKKKLSKDFPFSEIDRKNVKGLYWRINVLRNRSAHPDKPKYLTQNGKAQQFMGLSSRCLPAEISGKNIKIQCTLFDLTENQWMNDLLQSQIIDASGKEGADRRELTDILLPQRSPRGHGKDRPLLLAYGNQLKLFDYVNSFPGLANSMLNYIEAINHLLLKRLMTESHIISDIQIATSQDTNLSMDQLFTFE